MDVRLYAGGMAGAAAMSAVAAVGRRAGIDVNLETMLGAQVGDPRRHSTWLLGLAAQFVNGAIFARGYALVLDRLGLAPTVRRGAALGLLHGIVAGAAMTAAPAVHPKIPSEIPKPGPFMLRHGGREAALFLAVHVLFGVIVTASMRGRRR